LVSNASFFAANSLCSFVADEAWFAVEKNQLTGPIPTELGHLTKIHGFRVGGNMLTGTLPSEMGELSALGKL
jgi:hypothetical protein